jgi:hypothetical protein
MIASNKHPKWCASAEKLPFAVVRDFFGVVHSSYCAGFVRVLTDNHTREQQL